MFSWGLVIELLLLLPDDVLELIGKRWDGLSIGGIAVLAYSVATVGK